MRLDRLGRAEVPSWVVDGRARRDDSDERRAFILDGRTAPHRQGEAVVSDSETIRVLITDDHPIVRDGLRLNLSQEPDIQVVGEACDGAECIAKFGELLPDVLLLDLQMPKVDGIQAMTAIRQRYPDAAIVILTTYPGDARMDRALKLGATSYLFKSATRSDLLKAVRGAVVGEHFFATPEGTGQGITPLSALTVRELSVLRLVSLGQSNSEIATALFISEAAIKARMKNILAKLGATDRTHAVTVAMRRGFLD
jgi:DNA-binding NarL/FixJ family response regulator